jgi:hypothetical protein
VQEKKRGVGKTVKKEVGWSKRDRVNVGETRVRVRGWLE